MDEEIRPCPEISCPPIEGGIVFPRIPPGSTLAGGWFCTSCEFFEDGEDGDPEEPSCESCGCSTEEHIRSEVIAL